MSQIENIQLIIDEEDNYREKENVFYMNPSYLGLLRCVRNAQFSSCLIKNTSVDKLTSLHLVYIMQKLRQNGQVEIILDQPLYNYARF